MRKFRILAVAMSAILALAACGPSDPDGTGGGDGDAGYVFGGANTALNTQFGNGGDCLFSDPAGCFLHHQASFMAGPSGFFEVNFPDVAVAGETYDFFPQPAM